MDQSGYKTQSELPGGLPAASGAIRLIPAVDTFPKVVAFASTLSGKAVITGLFLLFSSFTPNLSAWPNLVAITFVGLANFRRPIKYGVVALWLFVFDVRLDFQNLSGIFVPREETEAIVQRLSAGLMDNFVVTRLASLAGTLVVVWVALTFLARKRSPMPIFWLLISLALLISGAVFIPLDSSIYLIIWGIVLHYASSIFPLAYYDNWRRDMGRVHQGEPGNFERISFVFQCFLMSGLRQPMLLSPDSFFARSQETPEAVLREAQCRLKALKLLLWSLVLWLLKDCIQRVFFGGEFRVFPFLNHHLHVPSLQWSNYVFIGFERYNALHVNPAQSWLIVLINAFQAMCNFAAFTGVVIAFIRLGGLYIPRDTCRPYLAKSFDEYFRRHIFYYCELLLNLFFYPIYRSLSHSRLPRSIRLSIALLLTVGAGGWLIHVAFSAQFFLYYGPKAVLPFFVSWIPYFSAVAVVCLIAMSGVLPKKIGSLPRAINLGVIFLVHSLLLTLIMPFTQESWQSRVQFWASLLGI